MGGFLLCGLVDAWGAGDVVKTLLLGVFKRCCACSKSLKTKLLLSKGFSSKSKLNCKNAKTAFLMGRLALNPGEPDVLDVSAVECKLRTTDHHVRWQFVCPLNNQVSVVLERAEQANTFNQAVELISSQASCWTVSISTLQLTFITAPAT